MNRMDISLMTDPSDCSVSTTSSLPKKKRKGFPFGLLSLRQFPASPQSFEVNLAPTKFGASAAALGNRSGSGTARSHDIFFRFLIRRDSLTCHFGADGNVVVDRRRLWRRAGHVLDPLRQVVRVVRNREHVGQDADPRRSQLLGVGGLAKYTLWINHT